MTRHLILAIAALWLSVIQASWVSPLPGHDFWACLPLVFMVLLIAEFRSREALTVAVAAGIALDALGSLPAGLHTALFLTCFLLADFLFQRVFTNQSLVARLGLQAAVFLGWLLGLAALRLVRASLLGWPWDAATVWPAGAWFLPALGLQLAFAVLAGLVRRGLFGRLMLAWAVSRR
jgi:cell shape-determining protein MreD